MNTNPLHTFEREVRTLTRRFAGIPGLVLRTVSSSERAELELFDGARVVARLVIHTSTTEPPPPATQPVLPGVSVAVSSPRPAPAVAPATEDEDGAELIELRATETRMRDLWHPDATVMDLGRGKGPWAAWSRAEDFHTWRTVVTRTEAQTILAVVPDLTLTLLPARSPLPHHVVRRDQLVLCGGGYDATPFYSEPGTVLDVRRVTVTDLTRMPHERTVLCAIVRLEDSDATWCAPLDRAQVTEDDHDFRLALWQPVTEEDGAWVVPPPFEPPPKKTAKKAATKKPAAKTKTTPKQVAAFSYGIAKGIEDATRAEVVAIAGELVTLGAHPTTFDWTPRLDGGTDANKKMFGLVNSLPPDVFNNGYFEERQLDPDADGIFFLRCWHTQCRSRNVRRGDLGPGLYCAPCAQAVREGKAPKKAKKTAPPRRVWIRESAWDELDPATQAALTEPVTGSSIAWDGREGAITAVIPSGELLDELADLAQRLDVTLFYGETPPPAEVVAVAPSTPVVYHRERSHVLDHLAKRAGVACLILTDSNGTRENKRPKKRTEAEWQRDIGELLAGACILEIARLYSQRGVCLWDSRDGERP